MLNLAMLSGWHVHADSYAQEFSEREGVKLAAMWDEQPERGVEFATKFNMAFEPDLDKLLANTEIDAVCVTTPTNLHPGVIIKAAKAGKHIFTEKVLALTNAEAADIKAAVEQSGVKFCISFPHRCMAHNIFAKQIVDGGELGVITYMRVRNAHNGTSRGWLPPHFYDAEACGGGAMMDLGAHPMYLIRWLMGKPVSISSVFTSVYGKPVEDNAVSVMNFENGAVAVSETGFVSEASPFTLELYGTEGSLTVNANGVQLNTAKTGGWAAQENLPADGTYPIEQFVRGVLHNEPITFGIGDAVGLTEMMDAAYRSYREGRVINV